MTTSQIYWLTRLDSIHSFLEFITITVVCIAGLVLFIMVLSATVGENEHHWGYIKRTAIYSSLIALLSGILSCLVPTTKELVAIYGISYLTQNKDAREIPAEALKVLNQKLKELSSGEDDKK